MLCLYGCCATCLCIGILLAILLVHTKAGLACIAILCAYFAFYSIKSFCAAEVHDADQAARVLYQKQHGKTPDLPDKLKGVFWFSNNAAPELLMCVEGQYFNPKQRLINFESAGTYSWSFSTGFVGWMYWCFLRCSYMLCSELHIKFEDDEYTSAKLDLYVCGCCKDGSRCDGCWMPMCQWWTMKQRDENSWDRDIYLYCMPWRRWKMGSYILKRVIDQDGEALPAFDEMMASLKSGEVVKGVHRKPVQQIMNGDDWKGYLLFGSAGNPEIAKLEEGTATV